MNRWLLIWLVFTGWLGYLPLQRAQSSFEFKNVQVINQFGEWIEFKAKLDVQPPQTISKAYLFIQPEKQNILLEEVNYTDTGEIDFRYDLTQANIRPFSHLDYWFRIYLSNGQEVISSKFSYTYTDNRFNWQQMETPSFQVGWYQGDLEFGQMIMNVAQNGLQSAQTYIPANPEKPIRIFVYSSASDLQTAIQLSGDSWVAGHASPDLGIILVSIPPGPEARLEMERQIPHELMHILQYSLMGESYSQMPVWLLEGLASLAEMYPNPEYQRSLKTAVETETLFGIASLCSSFPPESSGTFLAYAESASFVRFLHQKFGTSGIYGLINAYKDGVGCEEGFEIAFNAPLSQLEHRWQQEALGVDAEWLVLENLSPYLLLLLLITIVPMTTIILRKSIPQKESGG